MTKIRTQKKKRGGNHHNNRQRKSYRRKKSYQVGGNIEKISNKVELMLIHGVVIACRLYKLFKIIDPRLYPFNKNELNNSFNSKLILSKISELMNFLDIQKPLSFNFKLSKFGFVIIKIYFTI